MFGRYYEANKTIPLLQKSMIELARERNIDALTSMRNEPYYFHAAFNAIKELARLDDLESIQLISEQFEIPFNARVYSYALAANITRVNQLLPDSHHDYNAVVQGYRSGGHLKEPTILTILNQTTDEKLRELIIKAYLEEIRELFTSFMINTEEYLAILHRLDQWLSGQALENLPKWQEAKENETLFQQIYRLIKERNKFALKKLLKEGYSFSVPEGQYTSPLELLAEENDEGAIQFLHRYFPHHIDYKYLVKGWAFKANTAAINKWTAIANAGLAQGNYYIREKIVGFAKGLHLNLLTETLDFAEQLNLEWRLNSCIFGYALGEHVDQVNLILEENLSTESFSDLIKEAMAGYIIAGSIANAKKLEEKASDLFSSIFRFAFMGNLEEVNRILLIKVRDGDFIAYLEYAAEGYGMGGHRKLAEGLFNTYPEENQNYKLISRFLLGCLNGKYFNLLDPYFCLKKNDLFTSIENELELLNIKSIPPIMHEDEFEINSADRYAIELITIYFAHRLYMDNLDRLINQQPNHLLTGIYDYIIYALNKIQHLGPDKIERTLSSISSSELRAYIVNKQNQENKLLCSSNIICAIKDKYDHLPFRHVNLIRDHGLALYEWFLNGIQLVKNERLSSDLFIYISTFVTGFGPINTRLMIDSIHQRFLLLSTDKLYGEYKNGLLFSAKSFTEKHHEVEESYTSRYGLNF